MDSQPSTGKTWLAFSLLAIAYSFLGWYLAAHHVFWLISAFVVATTLFFAWKSNPILESLTWLIKQPVVIIIGITLIFSLVVAITLAQPILFSLMSLPFVTLLYALLEMRAAEFSQSKIFFWSVVIAGSGLGLGEAVDLFITPSMRY